MRFIDPDGRLAIPPDLIYQNRETGKEVARIAMPGKDVVLRTDATRPEDIEGMSRGEGPQLSAARSWSVGTRESREARYNISQMLNNVDYSDPSNPGTSLNVVSSAGEMLAWELTGLKIAAFGKNLLSGARQTTVYRVFGGDARAGGFSWTPVDPTKVSDFRNVAGLPSGGTSGSMNTAEFMLKGKVNMQDIIKSRSALPLDGNKGGLLEYIIDPNKVRITDFSILKP